jgi:hypothetical protein
MGVVDWEGYHPIASSPHGFNLEESFFLLRGKCGG